MKKSFSIAFSIWLRAQALYLLLNLLIPITWVVAAGLAVLCGIPALLLFWLYLYAVRSVAKNRVQIVVAAFAGGMVITFLATLLAAYFFDSHHTWRAFMDYIIFPAVAMLCAAVSILGSFRSLSQLLPANAGEIQEPATVIVPESFTQSSK